MSKLLKVLMVEDSEDDETLITRELNKGGFDSDVTRVQTADGMKKALKDKKWDIILSDYRMPGFSGLQALEILKESGSDIPFILISGTVGESLAVEAMKAGSCDYVMKDKLNRLDVAIERELRDAKIRHEKKRAEEALRESEQKYKFLIDKMHEMAIILDKAGTIMFANRSSLETFGYSEDEVIGKSMAGFLTKGSLMKALWAIAQEFLGNHHGEFEIEAKNKKGEIRTLLIAGSSNPIHKDGKMVGILVSASDITERKLAEEALRQSEARYRILFEQAADIILQMEIAPEGMPVIRDVNNAALRLLGYERNELIGQPVSFLNVASEGSQVIRERRENILSGIGTVFETKHRCKDGTIRDFECSATEMQVGSKTYAVSFERDITERKLVEELLKDSEQKFKNVFDNSAIGKSLTFLDGSVHVNPAFCQMLSYTMEEMAHQKWQNISHPDDVELSQKNLNQLLSGEKKSVRFIKRYFKKDGAFIWADVNTVLQKDKEGKPLYYITGVMDITERMRAEESLRQSEEKFKRLFEESPSGIAMVDTEGNLLEVNRSLLKLLGISREEMVGKNFTMLAAGFGLNTREQIADFGQRITGGTAMNELTFPNRDGKQTTITVQSATIMSKGQATGVLYIVNDTTERKVAEAALRESEARYHTLFDDAKDGIALADAETGRIVECNQALCSMVGKDKAELVGQPQSVLHPPQAVIDGHLPAFERHIKGDPGISVEDQIISKTGTLTPVEIKAARVQMNGRDYMLGIFRDVSERKQHEKEKEQLLSQLLQAQKMEAIGTLAGGVAHDFNNLLTAISGFTTMAMGKINESDPVQRDLRQVSTAATRAATLTRQLLLFSRKQHMEPMPLDPNATISRLLKMLDRLIGEDIVIEASLENDIWHILGDEGNIEQVVMNLSVNARDAMPEGGKLFIKTENVTIDDQYCRSNNMGRPGRFVCLSISDTGTGMDQLTQEHIFEPFFTTKGEGKGTGLGLSVVLGIVQQHKGWINVYSEPGHGTTFKVYIPSSSTRPDQGSKEESSYASLDGKGERIMVVEDQPEVRAIANQMLLTNGYSVFTVSSAKEAMELFEKENGRFDLVFSDVVLPDRSGVLLVQDLLKRWKFGVIITSGYTDEKANWDFIKENKFHFLHKPYAVRDLLLAVREVLEEKKK